MQRPIQILFIVLIMTALLSAILPAPASAQSGDANAAINRMFTNPISQNPFLLLVNPHLLNGQFSLHEGHSKLCQITGKCDNLIQAADLSNTHLEQEATPIPIEPVTTSTPNDDGIIIHVVKYGETLWSIAEAYGVPIDQILRNSGLSLATEEVYEGQTLVIQTATEPSPTPTATASPDPGTPPPRPPMTPVPTRTPAPTWTPTTPPPAVYRVLGNGKNMGLGLILVSGLGLILVVYLGFLKKS